MSFSLTPRTATVVASASWLFNFGAQMVGMLSTPNMKDVADAHHAFLAPQPFAIALFFFPQTCIQVYWIYQLAKAQPGYGMLRDGLLHEGEQPIEESQAVEETVRYVPYFALGNVCIGLWMLFWTNNHLGLSDILVNINSAAQLYYAFTQLGPLSKETLLTHIVCKMFAGIGILDVVDNASSAFLNYKDSGFHAGIVTYVLTFLVAAGLAAVSDLLLGVCVVYDLIALCAGQLAYDGLWAFILLAAAGLAAAIVVLKAAREKEVYRAVFLGGNTI
ncbi:hypothetical protein BCR37DRAFT_390455 [Protomyces lactucae-debilis]|uniref:Uncharacterized protein n=1 Tax=Protomyces lactucae-debilis TaxID=2754530 RepID=A0A1Y2FVC6_PROLT|nr:uncharacterized protein BCR37DRAFT_390455 [Protomyces lactucae-debilis]ORY87950.1 hypothetical protein BCR37DRAFT_390455 [Protomyces lactucae-debilis]